MSKDVFLPDFLSEKIAHYPEHHLGVHRVRAELRDGRTFFPVFVAWGLEVVRVEGSDVIPFTTDELADLYPEKSDNPL
jgi:hypothetical protein